MPFTIPSNDLAENAPIQSVWYDVDLAIIAAAMSGVGVLTGCSVTAQGSPDMTVAVAAGTIQPSAGAAAVSVSGGNVTITAAHATLPRLDLITASAAGVKTATDGTAASSPKPPDLPSGHIALAMIFVPATVTQITTARITSKRFVIPRIRVLSARAARTAGNYTLNNTSWTDLDTGLDLVLAAVTGDIIEIGVSGRWSGTGANEGYLDVATIVSGSPVNYLSGGGGASDHGIQALQALASTAMMIGGGVQYAVQAGDISAGTVTLRLRYRTSTATNKTIFALTTDPFQWSAKNLGQ